jgi:hypothetical protein
MNFHFTVNTILNTFPLNYSFKDAIHFSILMSKCCSSLYVGVGRKRINGYHTNCVTDYFNYLVLIQSSSQNMSEANIYVYKLKLNK